MKYYVSFATDSQNVEFRTFNTGATEITVEKIVVTRMIEEPGDSVEWQR